MNAAAMISVPSILYFSFFKIENYSFQSYDRLLKL